MAKFTSGRAAWFLKATMLPPVYSCGILLLTNSPPK